MNTDIRLISSSKVRKICGGISAPTLARWLKNEYGNKSEIRQYKNLNFPQPTRRINHRNYWDSKIIEAWAKEEQGKRTA